MKSKYLIDFIKDEEKEDFKRKIAVENRSKKEGQITREEIRKKYLEIAKEITDKINKLEDRYENCEIDTEEYIKKKDTLMELRNKNRDTYLRKK